MPSYLVTDCEFAWDEDLHEAHRAMDSSSNKHAVAVKRVVAAASFRFDVDEEGRVSIGAVNSWNEHDWGDEQAIISELFDSMRTEPQVPVLTYGGLATDVPVLLLGAMAHGLSLPPQLTDQPGRRGPRPHLDLGLMLKGGGRTWSHLSQVCLRLGVPANLVAAKPNVQVPNCAEGWAEMSAHVELDCLLLAIAKIGWLVAQGTDGLRFEPAVVSLIEAFLRRRPDHPCRAELVVYSNGLMQTIAGAYAFAA